MGFYDYSLVCLCLTARLNCQLEIIKSDTRLDDS